MATSLRSLIDRAGAAATGAGTRLVAAIRESRRFVAALVALLGLLAFMAAAPIRSLDAANQRVEHLQATKQQLTSSITELEQQKARLQDRRQIELMARRRFGLVHPGEDAYVVVTPEDELRTDATPEGGEHRAWYRWLLEAVTDMLPS